MKLPEIYKNKIDNNIRNNKTTFIGNKKDDDLLDKLPVSVVIETKSRLFNAYVVGKTDNYLVTSSKDVIRLKDIISIKKA